MNVKKLKKEKSEKEGIKTRLLYKTAGGFEIDWLDQLREFKNRIFID